MLGDIDYNKKPIKPQFFLCKSDRTVIGKLNNSFASTQRITYGNDVDDFNISVPYKIDLNHFLIENENIEKLKGLYKLKVVKGSNIYWYIINDIEDKTDDSQSYKVLNCKSLQYELTKKIITVYEQVAYNATQVFDDILKNTNWSYDYVDSDFKVNYREFNFTDQSVLDCIFNVAETYNALITFDTDKRTFDMRKPELFGVEDGLLLNTHKYMKSMDFKTDYDSIVTQLIVRLSDGLSIESVNPTGQDYLADYTYVLYPFQRDENKNVIQHSDHLSDNLCNALLDYDILVNNNRDTFKNALSSLNAEKAKLPDLEIEENKYRNQIKVTEDIYNGLMFGNNYSLFREMHTVNGSFSQSYQLRSDYRYGLIIAPTSGLTVKVDGNTVNTSSTEWTFVKKIANVNSVSVSANGNMQDFYFNIFKIDLDEYTSIGNEQALLYKYETFYLRQLLNNVNSRINNVKNSITQFQNTVNYLQNLMSVENNFTNEEIIELNNYNWTQIYENQDIIDPKLGYDEAVKKFKELQIPQFEISVDIVNFLNSIESQHDWDKLKLGNYATIKESETKIDIVARITEVNFDYDEETVTITLSNVKNRDSKFSRLEQMIYDNNKTSTIVSKKESVWDTASQSAQYINNLFNNFWDKVTNEINMAINETVQIDNRGITITDPNDPMRFLRATHGVLGLTRSGGLRFETAISADGIIAELILGKILTSQRVEIGDDDGFMLIKGASINIKDRCLRDVLTLGQLDTDTFGLKINRYSSSTDCSNKTILNRVSVTGTEGLVIERNRNGTFERTLYNSVNGDLFMKGNLQVGEGNQTFIANQQGISVGSSNWATAPFRVDMYGNAYMNKLTAETAVIKDSQFLAGEIIGSSVTLGESPNVIKLFPDIGFWAGADNFEDAPASIAMDGTAKFRNATFTNGDGVLLINTDTKQIEMNNFDIVGAGAIDTDLLSAQVLTADDGFIADLTANRISTLSAANVGAFSNYIKVENQDVKWVTGKASGSGTPKTLPDGRQLYWVDASKTGRMTTEVTSYPVMVYTMEEKTKMLWSFEGSGDEAIPFVAMGYGDGAGANSGKFIMKKPNGSMDMRYYASNTSAERAIAFLDLGLNIFTSNGEINIRNGDNANINIKSDGTITVTGKVWNFNLTG